MQKTAPSWGRQKAKSKPFGLQQTGQTRLTWMRGRSSQNHWDKSKTTIEVMSNSDKVVGITVARRKRYVVWHQNIIMAIGQYEETQTSLSSSGSSQSVAFDVHLHDGDGIQQGRGSLWGTYDPPSISQRGATRRVEVTDFRYWRRRPESLCSQGHRIWFCINGTHISVRTATPFPFNNDLIHIHSSSFREKVHLEQHFPVGSSPDWRKDPVFWMAAAFCLCDSMSSTLIVSSFEPTSKPGTGSAKLIRSLTKYGTRAKVRFHDEPLHQLPSINLTGHSCKKGASKALRDHLIPEEVINDRCGWTGHTMMQRSYSDDISLHQKLICTRVLVGANNKEVGAACSTLDAIRVSFVSPTIDKRLRRLWQVLFHNHLVLGLSDCVAEVLLASLLLHLPSIERSVGSGHILIHQVFSAAIYQANITETELRLCCQIVCESYCTGPNSFGFAPVDYGYLGRDKDTRLFARLASQFDHLSIQGMAQELANQLAKLAQQVGLLSQRIVALEHRLDYRQQNTAPDRGGLPIVTNTTGEIVLTNAGGGAGGGLAGPSSTPTNTAKIHNRHQKHDQHTTNQLRLMDHSSIPEKLKGITLLQLCQDWFALQWPIIKAETKLKLNRHTWSIIRCSVQHTCSFLPNGINQYHPTIHIN